MKRIKHWHKIALYIPTTLITQTLISSCVLLPPYSIYSRAYKGRDFEFLKNPSQSEIWNIVIPQAKNPIERNEQRYVYGALVEKIKRESTKNVRTFENGITKYVKTERVKIILGDQIKKDADLNVFVSWEDYGRNTFRIKNSDGSTQESQGTTHCFEMEIKLQGKKGADDIYTIRSNGCPGIFDPRPMASMLSKIWVDELMAKDGANVWLVRPRGNSPDSALSTFVTHNEVDKYLGFQAE